MILIEMYQVKEEDFCFAGSCLPIGDSATLWYNHTMDKKDPRPQTGGAAGMARSGRHILENKTYLYLTEFFAGMAVMAVELGANRLLAPYFSSSQIVWTIIIGTIMIAMALGNIYGGRKADKDPDPDKLYVRILIAAVWIAVIAVVGKYIILGIAAVLVFSVSHNFLIIAGFAACMVLFVFPCFLLGTVTPSLVKYTTDSLDDNGKVVGTLGACNTIGSILGTFLPTFVTIPAVGTTISFLLFSGVLLLLALVYFISTRGRKKTAAAGLAMFLACCLFGGQGSFAFWETDIVYEGESTYNYLQVKESPCSVILSTNVLFGVQSILRKDRELTGMYYDYAMAAPYMAGIYDTAFEGADADRSAEDPFEILILGNGTGTYATQCLKYFGGTETVASRAQRPVHIEGVEIDQKITDLAQEYFEMPGEVDVYTYDGRAYLNAVDKQYDVIMVDAYQDITIPFQMSSVEFFSMVHDHLKDGGVMVVNMNMRSDKAGSINEYLSDTIASVFGEVMTVDVEGGTNRELLATDRADCLSVMQRNVAAEENVDLKAMMWDVAGGLTAYSGGDLILTDDKAPVELLGMSVIDDLIGEETEYYRAVYEEGGITALLDLL